MKKWLLPIAIFLAVGSLIFGGLLKPIDRALTDLRFRVLEREASQTLVVVKVDSPSLQALNGWPWPREYHGALVDQLLAAGATQIAFTIEFSASSTPSSDAAFAAALERSNGTVILPSFLRESVPGEPNSERVEINPLELFGQFTTQGNANIGTGQDSVGRSQLPSDGLYPTSMAVMLAAIDRPVFNGEYFIDFSIDTDSIPQISYADILTGNFDVPDIAGKKIIVGATADELGDRHAVPNGKILPGPILQALAYESLIQERTIQESDIVLTLSIALILSLLFHWYFRAISWQRAAIVGFFSLALIQGLAVIVQATLPTSLNTAAWMAVIILIFAAELIREIETQAVEIIHEKMVNTNRAVMINSVFEGSFEGIVVTDADGKIEFANASAAEILGLDPGQMTGSSLDGILPQPGNPIFADEPKAIQEVDNHVTSHHVPVELELAPDTDTDHPVVVELILSESQLPERASNARKTTPSRQINVYKLRDITERKQTEKAIKEATIQALEANRAKSEFLANMSHELRTPLNAIIGFSEIIGTEQLGPVGTQKYTEYANDIESSGHHLLAVINDILDISKVESGTYRLSEELFDLGQILMTCQQIIAGTIANLPKKATCVIDDNIPLIYADPRLIRQIAINLLSNAVKFTAPDGLITLHAFLNKEGRPTIEVTDDGIGIEEHIIPELTKPFYQVEGALARSHGGAGLGLALVASHVKMHDGTLDIQSSPNNGTKVTINLPKSRLRPGAVLNADGDGDRSGNGNGPVSAIA